jgi:hypothetical protein
MKVLTGRALPCLLGLPVFALAVAIALPIPFGNIVPIVAVCVMIIGLIERDGLFVVVGILLTLLATFVAAALVHGAVFLMSAT